MTRESEELASKDDVSAQIPWRGARAKILARLGVAQEAERLAREGVALTEMTDSLNLRGEVLMDLAEVLRLLARPDEARDRATEAIEVFTRKGNTVMASRARAFIENLAPAPS